MNLFERLPEDDKDQLWSYLSYYSEGSVIPKDRLDHFLRYWNENKIPFYRAFGEQFIVKKELFLQKSTCELEEDMCEVISRGVVRDFCRQFMERARQIAADMDDYGQVYS